MTTLFIRSDPVALRHGSGIVADPVAMFFESFAPLEETGRPTVLMIHGGAHSGACWLLTADGRPGWAYDLVRRGYPVIVPDWPGVGRSGAIAADEQTFDTIYTSFSNLLDRIEGAVVLMTHSMGGPIGWRLAERHRDRLVALIAIAPGQPGNMQPEPEIVSSDETEMVLQTPYRRFTLPISGPVTNDGDFIDRKLIGSGTRFPAESRALYAASLLQLSSSLIRQRSNVGGSQLRIDDPHRLGGLPIVVITGTADLDHPRDHDAAIVAWLKAHGADARFIWLADHGITGNGHMMMLENNSVEISTLISDELDRLAAGTP